MEDNLFLLLKRYKKTQIDVAPMVLSQAGYLVRDRKSA